MIYAFLRLIIVSFFVGSTASPCVWCDYNQAIPVLELLHEDARYELNRSALLGGCSKIPSPEPLPLCLNQALTDQTPPTNDRFYTDYLLWYFPKADVITQLIFPTMCPVAVARALHSVTFLLTNVPWRYFVNDPSEIAFESVHVMIVEEQLKRIIEAVKKLRLDAGTGLLTYPALSTDGMGGGFFGSLLMAKHISLLQLWKKNNAGEELATMTALCADTMVHRLYGHIKRENYTEAYALQQEVQKMVELLKGSRYEEQYTLTARLFADLLKMLQQRLWQEHDDRSDDGVEAAAMLGGSIAGMSLNAPLVGVTSAQKFLDSFIEHYEVNITGKFTHEYHPALLEETARSFATLEEQLEGNDLPIVGRLTLMGYEEQGITRYKTKYTDAYFSDEMGKQTNAGWSLKMFNRFGLLTGFLCKDANKLAGKEGVLPVTHINPDQVETFDGIGTLFQEHAFGEAYVPTMQTYVKAQKLLRGKSFSRFFGECMRFWHTLYSRELKVTGKQHVVGTQDILFSIAYMRYLRQSAVPVLHFYIGPDITYPIETSLVHHKDVTRHAQAFVKTFVPQLKPLNNKKTAYVFCSFVDGVGKSTMLGNVQNMMKHGENIDAYEHVDNSSSQLATVFSYANDVVIADLPAQVSHFTYKPDGYVYVDCGALCDAQEMVMLTAYILKHKERLEQDFLHMMQHAQPLAASYDLMAAEAHNPEWSYALNLYLLGKAETTPWVSFAYEGNYYLFDRTRPNHIRRRVPLATAPSHGLKNCCPEQMIFSIGIRFPMAYDYFLNDLITQLKDKQVEQVVMVDFASMYSRSSRENIRVNYVIQQLALLHKDFSVGASFYQDFVHNAQLLATLDAPGMVQKFTNALIYESTVRLALFDMLVDHATTNIDGIDMRSLTTLLRQRIAGFDASVTAYVKTKVEQKIRQEHAGLFHAYGNTREYVTVQQFNASDLLAWSKALVDIFSGNKVLSHTSRLWQRFATADTVNGDSIIRDDITGLQTGYLDNGVPVEIIGRIPPDCHDRSQLGSLLRLARVRWYVTCANVLYARQGDDDTLIITKEKFPAIPLVVLLDAHGQLCFVQPVLDKIEGEGLKAPDYSLFEVAYSDKKTEQWRMYDNRLYLHDWSRVACSHGGIYAYGHELTTQPIDQVGHRRAIVSNLYTKFARAHGADKVLVPTQLRDMLQEKEKIDHRLKANYDEWGKEAEKQGCMPEDAPAPSLKNKESDGIIKTKMYMIGDEQRHAIQLYLRLIATMDMLVKDLDADFASRRNNKEDFIEHMRLTECITLPWLFGLFSYEPLFSAYEEVQPVCTVL